MIRIMFFILVSLSLTLATSCNTVDNNAQTTDQVVLPADFQDFLDTFHTDKAFQLEHIQFPLQGLPAMMQESQAELKSYAWQKEDWVMHNEFDPDNGEFEQVFTMIGDDLVIEKILHINGKLGLERRYVRSDDSWTLIYYAGMNFIRQDP